jgi:beta-galactosidase GanA
VLLFSNCLSTTKKNSFYIDYDENVFIKDDKPFQYISGSMHPYRVPKDYWQDRLDKMWASGINTIQL